MLGNFTAKKQVAGLWFLVMLPMPSGIGQQPIASEVQQYVTHELLVAEVIHDDAYP